MNREDIHDRLKELSATFEKEAEDRYPVQTHNTPENLSYVTSKEAFLHGCAFGAVKAIEGTGNGESTKRTAQRILEIIKESSTDYDIIDEIMEILSGYDGVVEVVDRDCDRAMRLMGSFMYAQEAAGTMASALLIRDPGHIELYEILKRRAYLPESEEERALILEESI